MKYFLVLSLLFISLYSQPKMFENPLSERLANYAINVNFDPDNKLLSASEVVNWKNNSTDYVASLYFHLYLNGLSHENTTLLKNSHDVLAALKDKWGACIVKNITLENGTDITKYIRFIHPDDSNQSDSTVIAVDLPSPVEPNGEITLNIEFEIRIPQLAIRCGYEKDFYHFSQWFPKLGVYENGEWVCHQYHSMGEFYSDYGVYDVSITTPSEYLIGASGIMLG